MIQWIVSLVFLFCFVGCVPSNQALTDLTGGDATTTKTVTVPSDLGNQAFQFTPANYDFGNRAVNAAPISTTVTIKNISTHTVYLSTVSGLSTAMSLVSDNCPRSPSPIVPNQSCTATISFAPTAGGLFNQSLTMTYGETVATNTSYTANVAISGTGVGTLSFAGINSISNIYSTQLKLNWTHVAGALMYYVMRVNADGSSTLITNVTPPTATYIVSGLTASTTYKYWVRATDTLGAFDTNANIVTTATNTTPPAPVITGQADYTFATANAITVGSSLSMNFDDIRTGNATDTAITYSCAYDQAVNSSVTATGNCSNLPGSYSLITTSGALSWTPTTQGAIGFYEFKITGTDTNSGLSGSAIFLLDVKPAYSTTNLIGNYSSNFANASYNETSGTTWQDLTTFNNDGTLTNFTFGGSTGWLGAGTIASPYRLGFDGTNDYVDLATMGNAATSMSVETWAKPTQISTTPVGIIMSNADSSTHGLMMREAKGYRGRVEVLLGDKSYADEVLADTPISYLRMGDISGEAPLDIGTTAHSWTAANITSYEQASPINNSDKSVLQNIVSPSAISSDLSFNPNPWGGVTYELWFKMTATNTFTTLVSHSTTTNNIFHTWLFINGGNLQLNWSDGTAYRSDTFAMATSLNTWYHLVASIDYTTRAYNVTLNGVNVRNVTLGFALNTTAMSSPKIWWGTYSALPTYTLSGYIDEMAVYNYALSGARAIAHYNAASNKFSCLSNRIDQSKWNHLAATFDQASTRLKLFTNNNNDCSITTSAITLNGSSAEMAIGAKVTAPNTPTAGTYFKGEITDARVYDSAISASQVAINMASQLDQFDIPNSISGLNLWFKADAITGKNNGDAMSTWTDSSSAGRNATQGTGSKQPIYVTNSINGKPAVRFDGVDDSMHILTTADSWSVFLVAKQISQPNSYNQIISGVEVWKHISDTVGGANAWYSLLPYGWNSWIYNPTQMGTTYHYETWIASPTLSEGWTDGIKFVSQTQNITGYSGAIYTLGNFYNDAQARYSNSEIAEVIAYSGVLTDAERRRIEGYLKAKYGL